MMRAKLGLTQQDVARVAGMSQSHYSFIEQGARLPRLDDVSGIAAAVGIPAKQLLVEETAGPTVPRAVATARRRIVPASRELGTAGA